MPEVARHRRSVGVEVKLNTYLFSKLLNFRNVSQLLTSMIIQERSHLDAAISFMGAFLGMQNCSQVSAWLKTNNVGSTIYLKLILFR